MPIVLLPGQDTSHGIEGQCGWLVAPEELCPDWVTYNEAQQELALSTAVAVLWAATGRHYGACELTVRPCQDSESIDAYRTYPVWWAGGNGSWPGSFPYLFNGKWFNGCGCGNKCCCRARCEIVLSGPVHSITDVMVDGITLAASEYRVDVANGEWLLVKTSEGCWPTCQDMNLPVSEENTFAVTYTRGTATPQSLLLAAARLSCEFGKSITNQECALPQRLSSLTRQGVTAEFVAQEVDIANFQTGINEVDMLIRALNPGQRTQPPRIYSPDMPTTGDRITVIGGS